MLFYFLLFFFKQKTAYEMRISDWSSDVCSSDLQDQARDVILARMSRAFETVDRDRVDAHALGRQRMTHRRALVHDLDAVRPEVVDMFLRLVARRLDELDAAVDDRLAIFRVRPSI